MGPNEGQETSWEVTMMHQTSEGLAEATAERWRKETATKCVKILHDLESGGCGRILAWEAG